jgi:hypothetical protein
MLAIDLKNAVGDPEVDNFTVLLFRLILKADGNNKRLLSLGYPVEVEMAKIFKGECPYIDDEKSHVDFDAIERMARERVGE